MEYRFPYRGKARFLTEDNKPNGMQIKTGAGINFPAPVFYVLRK